MLEFFANFDWFTPLKALIETGIHGIGHTFYVDLSAPWTGGQCEKYLRSKGIRVYGRCIAKGDAFFQVSKKQAEYAEYLLLQAGIPLKYHLFSEQNRQYVGQPSSVKPPMIWPWEIFNDLFRW